MRLVMMVGGIGFLAAFAPGLLAGEGSRAEKEAADWLYPGAKVVHSSGSSSEVGAVYCVVQETADDLAKVLKYYGDKLGIELPEMGSKQGGVTRPGVKMEYCHVGLTPGAAGRTATVSTFKTKAAVSTLVVSRSSDGKVSTVAITHVPQNAAK